MTFTVKRPNNRPDQTSRYSSATLRRAERAVCCSPFQLALFVAMQQQSVALRSVAGQVGLQQGYSRQPLSELTAENTLMWLIQVGLLRREVDGQGLTDSFRLTPLGYELVERWQQTGNQLPVATRQDRLYNALSRWLRLPVWLQLS